MYKISFNRKIFTYFEYAKENDFEKDVIERNIWSKICIKKNHGDRL